MKVVNIETKYKKATIQIRSIDDVQIDKETCRLQINVKGSNTAFRFSKDEEAEDAFNLITEAMRTST